MNILIRGAGAIGVYLAFRLSKGRNRVVLLDREGAPRKALLEQHGARVCNAFSVFEEDVDAAVLDRIPAGFHPDATIITVRAHQLAPALATHVDITPLLIVGSHFIEREDLPIGKGPTDFLFGFPGCASVVEEDGVVLYLDHGEDSSDQWGMTVGTWFSREGDDPGAVFFRELFENAGLNTRLEGDMRSVIWSQNCLRLPLLAALQLAGGRLDQLHGRRDLLKLMVLGTRETLGILKKNGCVPVPSSLEMYRLVPVFIISNMIRGRFSTLASGIGIEAFGEVSREETAYLAGQLLEFAEEAEGKTEETPVDTSERFEKPGKFGKKKKKRKSRVYATPHDYLLYLFSVFAREPDTVEDPELELE